MKQTIKTAIGVLAASALTFSALAQDATSPKIAENLSAPQGVMQDHRDRLKDTAKASDVIGMAVKNSQDEKLGKVENLAIDIESGRIVQVIISSGGFVGMDATLTPVPPGVLQHEDGQDFLTLDISKDKFAAAPKCDSSKWEEDTQSNRVTEVYSYYGRQPYFVTGEYGTTNTLASTLSRNPDGTLNTDGGRMMDKAKNTEIAQDAEGNNNNITPRNPEGSWRHNPSDPSFSSLGYVEKASKLMGASITNVQGEEIGKVDNFIVDLSGGRIVAVIISSGGYLGMGGELSAVPPGALRLNAEHDAFQLDTSKEMLASLPHFNANQWPDFNQPAYTSQVYGAYHVEPYFSTNAMAEPENTANNMRDRNNNALTPLDQGNSQADINTTAQIRKEVIATQGMSIDAKNVKIITLNGAVTLRGPVKSEDEKRQIGDIASRIARTGNVDNQLEVLDNNRGSIN